MDRIEDENVRVKKDKKRAKKRKGGLITALLIIFVLLIVPVGALFGCFYDSTRNNINYVEDFNRDKMFKSLAIDGFSTVPTDKALKVELTEDSFNNIIATELDGKLPAQVAKYITSVGIKIEDGKYTLIADVELGFFKTRAYVEVKIEEEDLEDYDKKISISLGDIKLGRISAKSIIDMINKDLLNVGMLKTLFEGVGFECEIDETNQKLIMQKSKLIKSVSKLLGIASDDHSIYSGIINTLLNKKNIDFSFTEGGKFSFGIDLTQYTNNSKYVTNHSLNVQDKIDTAKTYTEKLLNSDNFDATNVDKAFKYMIKGYDKIDSETKTYIDNLDMSVLSEEIPDKTQYKGLDIKSDQNLETIISSQMTMENIMNGSLATLTEENLNEYFKTLNDPLGTAYCLAGPSSKDDKQHLVYFVIDDFYTNIYKDGEGKAHSSFVITININGMKSYICLDSILEKKEDENLTLIANLGEIAYGQDTSISALKESLYGLISSSFQDSSYISFDAEEEAFYIEIEKCLNPSAKALYDSIPGIIGKPVVTNFVYTGNTLDDNGAIQITFDK